MRISEDKLQSMFRLAGIEKEKLHEALIKMGKKHLKTKAMKDNWSGDNPTKNYCYVIAEFVYYYLSPKGSKPFKLPGIPGDDGLHRFIMWPDNQIVDLAIDQFPNYEEVDYSNAKICYFMTTKNNKGPSKRTRILAEHLGFDLPEEREKEVNTKFW